MNYDKVHKLHEEFPLMFPRGSAGSCGDGWYDLLHSLCHGIQSHCEHNQLDHATLLGHIKGVKKAMQTGEWDSPELKTLWTREQISSDPLPWLEAAERDAKNVPEQVTVDQIKEKFGGLRFYYHGGDEFISGMVYFAEEQSTQICEACGMPGRPRHGGWIKTLCNTCYTPGV